MAAENARAPYSKPKQKRPPSIAAFFEQTLLNQHYASPHRVLYHYTSFSGAEGILDSQTFWATAHDCTNDEAELESANSIVTEVARACRQNAKRTPAKVLGIFLKNYPDSMISEMRVVYLSCFSVARDDESQWREYGDKGRGICLGIRVLEEAPVMSSEVVSAMFKVDYSAASLRDSLADSFGQICSKLACFPPSRIACEEGLFALYRIAATASILAKDEKWASEKEVRHVTFSRRKIGVTPKVRLAANGKSVRYLPVRMRAEGKLIALDEIIIGANQDTERARATLETRLGAKEYVVGSAEYPRISVSNVSVQI